MLVVHLDVNERLFLSCVVFSGFDYPGGAVEGGPHRQHRARHGAGAALHALPQHAPPGHQARQHSARPRGAYVNICCVCVCGLFVAVVDAGFLKQMYGIAWNSGS